MREIISCTNTLVRLLLSHCILLRESQKVSNSPASVGSPPPSLATALASLRLPHALVLSILYEGQSSLIAFLNKQRQTQTQQPTEGKSPSASLLRLLSAALSPRKLVDAIRYARAAALGSKAPGSSTADRSSSRTASEVDPAPDDDPLISSIATWAASSIACLLALQRAPAEAARPILAVLLEPLLQAASSEPNHASSTSLSSTSPGGTDPGRGPSALALALAEAERELALCVRRLLASTAALSTPLSAYLPGGPRAKVGVPGSYERQPYYDATLDRAKAEALISKRGLVRGSFVVRPSSQAGALSLTHVDPESGRLGHGLVRRFPSGWGMEDEPERFQLLTMLLLSLPLRHEDYLTTALAYPATKRRDTATRKIYVQLAPESTMPAAPPADRSQPPLNQPPLRPRQPDSTQSATVGYACDLCGRRYMDQVDRDYHRTLRHPDAPPPPPAPAAAGTAAQGAAGTAAASAGLSTTSSSAASGGPFVRKAATNTARARADQLRAAFARIDAERDRIADAVAADLRADEEDGGEGGEDEADEELDDAALREIVPVQAPEDSRILQEFVQLMEGASDEELRTIAPLVDELEVLDKWRQVREVELIAVEDQLYESATAARAELAKYDTEEECYYSLAQLSASLEMHRQLIAASKAAAARFQAAAAKVTALDAKTAKVAAVSTAASAASSLADDSRTVTDALVAASASLLDEIAPATTLLHDVFIRGG